MISLGIDPSTTATGIVVLEGNGTAKPKLAYHEVFKRKLKLLELCSDTAEKLETMIVDFKPDIITIEGYGLNLKNASAVVPLVTLGAILRYYLYCHDIKSLQPSPGELKKFTTGKGNSPKEIVLREVYRRWGYSASDNNDADAYALAALGLAWKGKLGKLKNFEFEVVGGLKLS